MKLQTGVKNVNLLHLAAAVDVNDEIKLIKNVLLPEMTTWMKINQLPTRILIMPKYEQSLYDYLKNYDWDNRDLSFVYPERKTIMKQIITSLKFLHSLQIVHGDIKPSNYLLRRKTDNSIETVLTDFGISRSLAEIQITNDELNITNLTDFEDAVKNNTIKFKSRKIENFRGGTPGFASPEQCIGKLSLKSDIYSFGRMLPFLMLPMETCLHLFYEPNTSQSDDLPPQEILQFTSLLQFVNLVVFFDQKRIIN